MKEEVELPEWYVEWNIDAFPRLEVNVIAALATFRTAGAIPFVHNVMKGSVFGGATNDRSVEVIRRSMRGHWEVCFDERCEGAIPKESVEVARRFTNDLTATVRAGIHWLSGSEIHAVLDGLTENIITARQVARPSGDARRREGQTGP